MRPTLLDQPKIEPRAWGHCPRQPWADFPQAGTPDAHASPTEPARLLLLIYLRFLIPRPSIDTYAPSKRAWTLATHGKAKDHEGTEPKYQSKKGFGAPGK